MTFEKLNSNVSLSEELTDILVSSLGETFPSKTKFDEAVS